MGSSRPSSG
jgi:limonene-1,2-epoxide hydrolase